MTARRGTRLIAKSVVDGWETRLRRAVLHALDDQLVLTRRQLRDGLTAAGTAGRRATTAAITGIALYNLWSDDSWQKYVAMYLEPVVGDIELEAASSAADAVGGSAVWGFSSSGVMSAWVVGLATASGVYLGKRLDDAGTGSDPQESVDDVLATSAAIIGGVVGAAAVAIANAATNEVGQYVLGSASTTYSGAVQIWNAMDDERTREAHADADGQVVPIGEAFDVGGEQLQYPGDPGGSDDNIINCRCWVTQEGLDGASSDVTQSGDAEAA